MSLAEIQQEFSAPASDPQAHAQARLDELAALQPGWYDGAGSAIAPSSIAWAREFAAAWCEDPARPSAYFFPTEDGWISLEWSFGPWQCSVVIDDRKQPLRVYATRGRDDGEAEIPSSLTPAETARAIAGWFRGLLVPV